MKDFDEMTEEEQSNMVKKHVIKLQKVSLGEPMRVVHSALTYMIKDIIWNWSSDKDDSIKRLVTYLEQEPLEDDS